LILSGEKERGKGEGKRRGGEKVRGRKGEGEKR